MTYTEVVFTLSSGEEFYRDLLIDALGTAGFDTFEETEAGFKAYIATDVFRESIVQEVLATFPEASATYQVNQILPQNWNEVWESNFSPITIGTQCYVRATFHAPQPEYPIEIVIDPKMAFGTGHHQTTSMMMELMLDEEFKGKDVLDMGCGTGILSILARKLGAQKVVAIDNDENCFYSTLENTRLNDVAGIEAVLGSSESVPNIKFDLILANINRNILLDQMRTYSSALQPGGVLLMSGFYQSDLPIIQSEAAKVELDFIKNKNVDNWVAAKFVRRS